MSIISSLISLGDFFYFLTLNFYLKFLERQNIIFFIILIITKYYFLSLKISFEEFFYLLKKYKICELLEIIKSIEEKKIKSVELIKGYKSIKFFEYKVLAIKNNNVKLLTILSYKNLKFIPLLKKKQKNTKLNLI